ncbi:MAG: hypothetical protein Q7S52_03595 [bacterium]|nr:hypothetical protein [bacterium]
MRKYFIVSLAIFSLFFFARPAEAAITEVGSDTGSGTSNAITTGLHGLTINSGDVIVAFVMINSNSVSHFIIDNNGATPFTDVYGEFQNTSNYFIKSRIAGASEPTSYNWTISASDSMAYVVTIRVFRGVHADIWDVTPATTTRDVAGSGTTATAPTMTTLTDGALGMLAFFTDGTPGYSSPTNGYGTEVEVAVTEDVASYIRTFATSSVIGTSAATLGGSNDWVAHQFALKPAATGAQATLKSLVTIRKAKVTIRAGKLRTMASFASDTFTDTDGVLLQDHTSDSGHAWAESGGAGNDLVINSNRINPATNGSLALYYISATSANADYDVQADFKVSASDNVSALLSGRVATGTETGYGVRFSGGTWTLYSFVTGTVTSLGTYTGDVPSSTAKTVKLQMRGTAIAVFIDSVSRISVTNSAVTAAGRAGVGSYFSDTSALRYLDNWSATDVPPGPRGSVKIKGRW